MSVLMEAADLIGGRYELLSSVGRGVLGEVYVALDRLSERRVALKRVHRRYNAVDAQVALAHEFSVLASLRHPHVISVLDYGFEANGQPFYTMTYLEDAVTIQEAAEGQPPEAVVALIFQLLQALAYLHRQGILHRDLKPPNVLVREGQVTLLDFSLASTTDASVEGGTPRYMAPEVLGGEAPSTASDLFGVGVLAYEMLTGKLPFEGRTPASLLASMLVGEPDLEHLPVGEGMRSIVRRLLSKDPEDRFGDANRIIEAFASAAGLDVPFETAALRDSYVRAAAFVGRQEELGRLTEALDEAQERYGSSWLIGGESGVGKSRLIAEVRSLALVRGFVVLRGQAITEAGKPYELFKAPLLRLLLEVEVTDEEAGVLKSVFPGVERIIGREVADAPALDSQAVGDRLGETIEGLFSRIPRPVLLEVEDCHWAYEGLLLLERLNRIVGTAPLLILGTYRDDERPEIPSNHPSMNLIKVERFRPEEMVELGASMLGDSIGRDQRFAAFLARETEGNAFFLTEAVRAIAAEVGRLDQVQSATLPDSVFSEEMRSLMLRRLEKLPASAMPGIQASALIGRRIDPEILAKVIPEIEMESWLALCGGSAVLEPRGYGWQFAHDKLREIILEEIDVETRRSLHQGIAEAIETLHGTGSPKWIPALAIHWDGAGLPEKAIPYLMTAAIAVFSDGGAAETVRLSMRTVELLGFPMPEASEMGGAIPVEMAKIQELMAGRQPEELADLPVLTDQAVDTVIEVLRISIPGAFQSHQVEVFAMLILRSVSLSLEHGVGPNGAYSFAVYAILLRSMTGDPDLALDFIRLAETWDERTEGRVSSAVGFIRGWFINHWLYHVDDNLPLFERAAHVGAETGDVQFGCFSWAAKVVSLRVAGRPLAEVIEASRRGHEEIAHRVYVAEYHAVHEGQVAKALAGLTDSLLSLTDGAFDEEKDVASVCDTSNVSQIAYFYGAMCRLHYLSGDPRAALDFAEKELALLGAFAGQPEEQDSTLFLGLCLVAMAERSDPERREELLERARQSEQQLSGWANRCESNFTHKVLLMNGVLAGADDRPGDALGFFDRAVESATEFGFLQYIALGHELSAQALKRSGEREAGSDRLGQAIEAYRRWGATAKADALAGRTA